MASITLDPEAIGQLSGERKALLDAIDSLRKHGIGRFVDLPQIIVVGDQSSGKSSVLEAISRVRFPVKDGVCTRFATELVLRTDPQTQVHVQVQPASASSSEAYSFSETSFDKDDLPRITEEAKRRLLSGSASFSEDVLRIEISSPDVPHLTLVDLPGFYHSEDEDQPADGRDIVDRLVETYMARKNSIILAIVSARNQVVMQKVLSKVKAHDNTRERTLGIVTKPDLLLSGSQDEDKFIKLVRNQEQSHRFALGWHVLRNRSEAEGSVSPEERDSKESQFFGAGIWSAIPSNSRGIDTLRKKLANILLDHIRKNMDTLIQDIQDNINSRTRVLERLGAPRSTPLQLRAHLDKIASQFQLLSRRAIEGNYSDEFFGGLYPDSLEYSMDDRIRKLRALVRDLNRTFAYVLATKGSRRIIVPDHADDGDGSDQAAQGQKIGLPSFLRVLETQYRFDEPEQVTRSVIQAELEPLSSANQGTEFPGTTNDLLAVKLFQDQSRPWEAIARFHIDLLLRISKSFTEMLVAHITGSDQTTCSAILLNIVDPFFEKQTLKLEDKLQELLCHFQTGYPQPSDAEFRATLAKRRQKHLTAEILKDLLANRPELFTENGRRQLSGLASSERKSEFGVDSLVDKSETYYELSLRNFTDNVIILGIENCLIKELPSILTTSAVSQMGDDVLEKLAAESDDIQVERLEVEAERETLREGLDLCKSYRSRNSAAIPAIPLHLEVNSPTTTSTAGTLDPTPNSSQQSPTPTPESHRQGASASTPASGAADATSATTKGVGVSQKGLNFHTAIPPTGSATPTNTFAKYSSAPISGADSPSSSSRNPSPFATFANKNPKIVFGKPTGGFDIPINPKSNKNSTSESTSNSTSTRKPGLFDSVKTNSNEVPTIGSVFAMAAVPTPSQSGPPSTNSNQASPGPGFVPTTAIRPSLFGSSNTNSNQAPTSGPVFAPAAAQAPSLFGVPSTNSNPTSTSGSGVTSSTADEAQLRAQLNALLKPGTSMSGHPAHQISTWGNKSTTATNTATAGTSLFGPPANAALSKQAY
ncbi:P-loop containing nucleoside triphosphate hydrolase protein [Nemania sp. NC0429]|nr:P-loop containing nucleoside triphosphate hydrolase protein [Nemania sp. NC0429]